MAKRLNSMAVDELIAKILAGEKDLSYIKLDPHADLSGHNGFRELNIYLIKTCCNSSALNLSYSKIPNVQARDLYLPFAKLIGTNLSGANLAGANLQRVNLTKANLKYAVLTNAVLEEANLVYADLREADFTKADLKYAVLRVANCEGTDFTEADIRKVVGLEEAMFIEDAIFHGTIVTKKEQDIVLKAMELNESFDVRA